MYNQGIYVGRGGGGGGGSTVSTIRITAADFSGDSYTNSTLIGKTAQTNFDVYTAEGLGELLNVNDGYTFDNTTGTITVPSGAAGKYMIIKYS